MPRSNPSASRQLVRWAPLVASLAACGPSSGSLAPAPGPATGAPSAPTPAPAAPAVPEAPATGPGAAAAGPGEAPPGGEACASSVDEAALALALKGVGEALARRDMAGLARLAHPTKGVRFSPYAYVDKGGDVVLAARTLAGAMGDSKVRVWGSYDGSGDPIRLSFRGYFEAFVYDRDFVHAGQYARGRTLRTGNTKSNLCEAYPGAAFVEYHVPDADPDRAGMNWASLRLVFEAAPGGVYLVGVVHDRWTI